MPLGWRTAFVHFAKHKNANCRRGNTPNRLLSLSEQPFLPSLWRTPTGLSFTLAGIKGWWSMWVVNRPSWNTLFPAAVVQPPDLLFAPNRASAGGRDGAPVGWGLSRSRGVLAHAVDWTNAAHCPDLLQMGRPLGDLLVPPPTGTRFWQAGHFPLSQQPPFCFPSCLSS